jgi:hypothetical protein
MPLLNSEYLSNWYTLSFDGVGNLGTRICIAESFTQAKIQEASNKSAIQGDIGTHIMDIGGKYYTSSVSAPVLIGYTDADVFDVFDLIGHFTSYQSNTVPNNFFNNPDGNVYLLKSATIDISADAVKATANFEGDNRINIATYVSNAPDNLYARTARFYDTKFTLGLIGTTAETFNILSGNININFDIDKVYILNSTQAPRFAIRGYSATGSIKLAITPEDYANYLDNPEIIYGSEQTPGILNTTLSGAELSIAPFVENGRKVLLGAFAVITKMEFNMQQNSIITANVEFAAYFNKDSTIVTNI